MLMRNGFPISFIQLNIQLALHLNFLCQKINFLSVNEMEKDITHIQDCSVLSYKSIV